MSNVINLVSLDLESELSQPESLETSMWHCVSHIKEVMDLASKKIKVKDSPCLFSCWLYSNNRWLSMLILKIIYEGTEWSSNGGNFHLAASIFTSKYKTGWTILTTEESWGGREDAQMGWKEELQPCFPASSAPGNLLEPFAKYPRILNY